MKIVLIRHPEPDVEPGICYGRRLDLALTPRGMLVAQNLGADPSLGGLKAVWTSPARRCHIAAKMISDRLTLPLAVDPRLHEFDFGEWEGRKWGDIPRSDIDRWAAEPMTFRPPGGETAADLMARITEFVSERVAAEQDCVIISHGGPLKILSAQFRGLRPDPLAPSHAFGIPMVIDPVVAAAERRTSIQAAS